MYFLISTCLLRHKMGRAVTLPNVLQLSGPNLFVNKFDYHNKFILKKNHITHINITTLYVPDTNLYSLGLSHIFPKVLCSR